MINLLNFFQKNQTQNLFIISNFDINSKSGT